MGFVASRCAVVTLPLRALRDRINAVQSFRALCCSVGDIVLLSSMYGLTSFALTSPDLLSYGDDPGLAACLPSGGSLPWGVLDIAAKRRETTLRLYKKEQMMNKFWSAGGDQAIVLRIRDL